MHLEVMHLETINLEVIHLVSQRLLTLSPVQAIAALVDGFFSKQLIRQKQQIQHEQFAR